MFTFLERLTRVEIAQQRKYTPSATFLSVYHKENLESGRSLRKAYSFPGTKETLPPKYLSKAPEGKETYTVQPYWTGIVEEFNTYLLNHDSVVRMVDTHNTDLIQSKRPDCAFLLRDGAKHVNNIVGFGEWKGTGKIDNKAFGQVEDYLEGVMREQPERPFMFAFLSDNHDLHIVNCVRSTSEGLRFEWADPVTMKSQSAVKFFSFLVFSPLEKLGYTLPNIGRNANVTGYLNTGATSHVYRGILNSEDVVIKLYINSDGRYLKEKAILELLADVPCIPKLRFSETENVLFMTPLGKLFSSTDRITPAHITQLVDTLFQAHCKKIIHCDIRLDNIIFTNDGVLLIDWGCSRQQTGWSCLYNEFEGAVMEASNNILDSLINKKTVHWCASDDLHAVARTLYLHLLPERPRDYDTVKHFLTKQKSLKSIQEFWQNRGQDWQKLFTLADNANTNDEGTYKKFASKLCGLF